jgi:hypothetical protein
MKTSIDLIAPASEATAGDRELALLRAITSAPANVNVTENAIRQIRAHVEAEVAKWKKLALDADECREAAEAERDALRATVAKMREALVPLVKYANDSKLIALSVQYFEEAVRVKGLAEAGERALAPKEGKS